MAREFEQAFEEVDVLVGPTTPGPAFLLGERTDDPLAMYAADLLTVPANLAGLPAVSVPSGFVSDGGTRLPVGLQFTAAPMRDELVLGVARAYQEATDHLEAPA